MRLDSPFAVVARRCLTGWTVSPVRSRLPRWLTLPVGRPVTLDVRCPQCYRLHIYGYGSVPDYTALVTVPIWWLFEQQLFPG